MKKSYLLFLTLFVFITLDSFAQNTPNSEPSEKFAVIEFEETTFDFGTIKQGEKVSHVYVFTNTGEIPLVITNARGSCGCTVPFFPQDPILPGESSEIEVEFNSKGKKNKQSKKVTITANTELSQTFLTIRGNVSTEGLESPSQTKALAEQRAKEEKDMEALSPNCFAIYPNPTSEILQLELKDYISKSAKIEIHNEMGQKVMSKNIEKISRASTQFDVSSFSSGIYIISIFVTDSKPMSQCFVVRN